MLRSVFRIAINKENKTNKIKEDRKRLKGKRKRARIRN